jgi:catechol 2,3-dioxygenase-like lactoylglutathione lyase family enzyme
MPTVDIDHIALKTADPERFIEFYSRFGFTIDDAGYREGTRRWFNILIGPTSKLVVHAPDFVQPDGLQAPASVPGAAHVCFVWEGSTEECEQMLKDVGVEVIWGPRAGGGARQGVAGTHLYARDPDDNLLEWMIYELTG